MMMTATFGLPPNDDDGDVKLLLLLLRLDCHQIRIARLTAFGQPCLLMIMMTMMTMMTMMMMIDVNVDNERLAYNIKI